MALEPTSMIGGALSVTIQMAKLGMKTAEAPEEIRVVCDMTQRVYRAFKEYVRLSQTPAVKEYWKRVPAQKSFVDESIKDTLETLTDIGRYMEPSRLDQIKYGRVKMINKLNWAIMDKEMALMQQKKLEMDHTDLMHHIDKLHKVEAESTLPTISQLSLVTNASFGESSGAPPSYYVVNSRSKENRYADKVQVSEWKEEGDATIMSPWLRRQMMQAQQEAGKKRLENWTQTESGLNSEQSFKGDSLGIMTTFIHDMEEEGTPAPVLQQRLSDQLPHEQPLELSLESQLEMVFQSVSKSSRTLADKEQTPIKSLEVCPPAGSLARKLSTAEERRRRTKLRFSKEEEDEVE
ncbi:hypothetical protein SLS56_005220 [Neofusicoccum ribis]|uniref:Uncharacterized protein n=1 Tax=Neofusicoccum ribis TaxID=45134 RepID=A0ABR3SU91_9PEZI